MTLNRIDILTQEERNQLLNEFNIRKANQYEEQTISQLFEQQAARTPKASALVSGDKTLTYQELDEWSNGIAHIAQQRC